MTDPSLARDRAPDMDDPRMTHIVDYPADLKGKLYAALEEVIQAEPRNPTSPRRAESYFAALTNAQRLAAELVEYTHQSVGLPVPADVAALLGRAPVAHSGGAPGSSDSDARCTTHSSSLSP